MATDETPGTAAWFLDSRMAEGRLAQQARIVNPAAWDLKVRRRGDLAEGALRPPQEMAGIDPRRLDMRIAVDGRTPFAVSPYPAAGDGFGFPIGEPDPARNTLLRALMLGETLTIRLHWPGGGEAAPVFSLNSSNDAIALALGIPALGDGKGRNPAEPEPPDAEHSDPVAAFAEIFESAQQACARLTGKSAGECRSRLAACVEQPGIGPDELEACLSDESGSAAR